VVTATHQAGLTSAETIQGVEVNRLRARRLISIFLELAKMFPRIVRSDVVHCHDYVAFYWYLPFRLLLPWKKSFITFHGFEGYPPPRQAVRRRRIAALLSSRTFCVGRILTKWYGTPCTEAIYGGVEPATYFGENPRKVMRAAFVGRLEPDTGIVFFLQVVQRLRVERGIALPIDVCGAGSELPRAQVLAAELGVDAAFHGWVEDPSPYLLRSRFSFASGYLGALESLAAGCMTFIAPGHPIRAEAMRDFPAPEGTLFVCPTPSEAASAIADSIESMDRLEAISGAGRAFARQHTWGELAKRYLLVYSPGR
jgi:glycosyltransferase involved in cell wall biosynthesis